MVASGNSSEAMPEFSVLSAPNSKLDLPNNVVWKGIQLQADEVLLYITEKGEKHIITSHPFDENSYYKIILVDEST